MDDLFLGIDGGGTKTDTCLIDSNKNIVNKSKGGPTNHFAVGMTEAVNNLIKVVRDTLGTQHPKSLKLFIALAGMDTAQDRKAWSESLKSDEYFRSLTPFDNLRIENDTIAALKSGTDNQNSLVVISGTGSVAFGKNESGATHKTGGMKQILSDEGSGYDLGLQALKLITKSLDGRIEKTSLTDFLFRQHSLRDLEDLHNLVYEKPWNKTDIAAIAPIVAQAAREGDTAALMICDNAAQELTLMVKTVIDQLSLNQKPFDVVIVGSVFDEIEFVKDPFVEQLENLYSNIKFQTPKLEYAYAAALLAIENDVRN